MEKTKEFILKKQEEKRRLEEAPSECAICKKEIIIEIDKNKPRWQWNMESGSLLCKNCYDSKEAKAAKMGTSQIINLLKIANNQLPLVEHR